MTKHKQTKAQRIVELEQKLSDALAGQVHTHHFADAALANMLKANFAGSGVVLKITALGGREIVAPTLIRGGLSIESIDALRADLVRSYKDAIVFKPKGAA